MYCCLQFFSISAKFILLKKFLNNIINISPTENSKDARPKIKKLVDNIVNSSLLVPNIKQYVYKVNQVISEKNNKFKKLLGFKQNPNILIQIITFQ